jgi:hypothetical protein
VEITEGSIDGGTGITWKDLTKVRICCYICDMERVAMEGPEAVKEYVSHAPDSC